ERAHGDACEHVDVTLTFGVPEHGALAPRNHDRSLSIVWIEKPVAELGELTLGAHGCGDIALWSSVGIRRTLVTSQKTSGSAAVPEPNGAGRGTTPRLI